MMIIIPFTGRAKIMAYCDVVCGRPGNGAGFTRPSTDKATIYPGLGVPGIF
jgi:hypothetical protein